MGEGFLGLYDDVLLVDYMYYILYMLYEYYVSAVKINFFK